MPRVAVPIATVRPPAAVPSALGHVAFAAEAEADDARTILLVALGDWLVGAATTTRHSDAMIRARGMLTGDVETPSSRVLREISEQNISYSGLMGRYAEEWHRRFNAHRLPSEIRTGLADEAIASLRRQRAVESADILPFDEFLHEFYAQYRR